jgi:hypothetical protein
MAWASAVFRSILRASRGASVMFLSTVMWGKRLKDW